MNVLKNLRTYSGNYGIELSFSHLSSTLTRTTQESTLAGSTLSLESVNARQQGQLILRALTHVWVILSSVVYLKNIEIVGHTDTLYCSRWILETQQLT